MKKDTRARIQLYRSMLPHMRERVMAAAMVLLISLIAAVTASYAWVTLSYAPEVGAVATTLSSNGSLEIGLSDEEGNQPLEFDIDEAAGFSTDLLVSNRRWGNLINLSDERYGMNKITLRPAQLNPVAIKTNPLYGASYGADGRIDTVSSNYIYATWDGTQFIYSTKNGVRAIANYITTVSDASQATWNAMGKAVESARAVVDSKYSQIEPKMAALGPLLSKFVQMKVDGQNNAFEKSELNSMYDMYNSLYQAMLPQKDVYVALANFQSYSKNSSEYEPITWEQIESNKAKYNVETATDVSADGTISLVGLNTFIADFKSVEEDTNYLKQYCNGTAAIYWDKGGVSGHNIDQMVNKLIAYTTMTMIYNGEEVVLVDLKNQMLDSSGNISYGAAISFYTRMNKKNTNVYVYGGIIKRFEQSCVSPGARLSGKNALTISFKKFLTITIYGKPFTKASGAADIEKAYGAAKGQQMVASDAVAQDTYGMVFDFWVRCNAEQTYLTLEGAKTVDEDGKIVAYDGVNRIWGSTGEAALTTDSTTQGGGSCYIYYADTPEDMARSLRLLESMKVALVDTASGEHYATACMDTDNYLATYGRVVVPMYIDNTAGLEYTFTDSANAEQTGRAITELVIDEPKGISAIVYLDGLKLTNSDVLSASEIEGQMNLQFGSSTQLQTVGDNHLLTATRSVTADIARTVMDYDDVNDDLTTSVTVRVNGDPAQKVEAFFVRAVNNQQGQRQAMMNFSDQGDGVWETTCTFPAPGTYYLRYVRLDGVDYPLAEPLKVTVKGFVVESVTWSESGNEATYFTADSSYQETVTVRYAADDSSAHRIPNKVQARFIRDDGIAVNIDLKRNPNTGAWVGTGTFQTSGAYKLSYLVQDGRYEDLESKGFAKTLNLFLGLHAEVYNEAGVTLNDRYAADAAPGVYYKRVAVKIVDNAGHELSGLEGAKLRYTPLTADTNLTWDEERNLYTGELQIVNAGRYTFSSVVIGGDTLRNATVSPVYVIAPPDPPTYINTVHSDFSQTDGKTQFAPGTNDAYMGPIRIKYSSAATIQATVYNDEVKDGSGNVFDYVIPMGSINDSGSVIYRIGDDWYIKLPTYDYYVDKDNKVESQEGIWKLKELRLWNCYDAEGNYIEASNPMKITSGLDVHTTEVSCSINIKMVPGTTTLGNGSTPFMSKITAADSGMYVTILDNNGRVIPADKIKDVSLTASYDNESSTGHGYYVSPATDKSITIKLNELDTTTGRWEVSANDDWSYVGEYVVDKLKVTTSANDEIIKQVGEDGVPEKYTVTTAGPKTENLEIVSITQSGTTFGKTGGAVNGQFLQSYDPGITAKLALKYTDENGATRTADYVRLEGVDLKLKMTYLDGTSAPNGGYDFSSSSYSTITMPMKEQTVGSNEYKTSATPLLAGNYKLSVSMAVGGAAAAEVTDGLSNIAVFSKQPTVTVTGVTPTGNINVNIAADGQAHNNMTLQNAYSDHSATVYYAVNGNSYTVPQVSFKLDGVNPAYYNRATLTIPNGQSVSKSNSANFGTGTTATTNVGAVSGETRYFAGNQNVDSITIIGKDSNAYVVTLTDSINILQELEPPVISYSGENMTMALTCGGKMIGSGSILNAGQSYTLVVTAQDGYYNPSVEKPANVTNWVANEGADSSTYTFTVGDKAVMLSGTILAYPTVKLSGSNVSYTIGGEEKTGTFGVKPDTEVIVTVTPKTNYWKPVATVIGAAATASTGDDASTYSFRMPTTDVEVKGSATEYPTLDWTEDGVTLNVGANGGDLGHGAKVRPGTTVSVTATLKDHYVNPQVTVTAGGVTITNNSFKMPDNNVKLKGSATKQYLLTVKDGDNGSYVTLTLSNGIQSGDYITPGVKVNYSCTVKDGYESPTVSSQQVTVSGSSGSFTMPSKDVTLTKSCTQSSCVAAGTLITMGDGSQKAIEDLVQGDYIRCVNHFTGKIEVMPVLALASHGWDYYDVLHLTFEEDVKLNIIEEHCLFDKTVEQYVSINCQNFGEYIGHEFAYVDPANNEVSYLKLLNANTIHEYSNAYAIFSYQNINALTNCLISTSMHLDTMLNYFNFDGIKYDEADIRESVEQYGLFDYSDFSDVTSVEIYSALPTNYFKIAIFKGYIQADCINIIASSFDILIGNDGTGFTDCDYDFADVAGYFSRLYDFALEYEKTESISTGTIIKSNSAVVQRPMHQFTGYRPLVK